MGASGFDLAALEKIQRQLGERRFRDLVGIFLENTPDRLRRVRQGASSDDLDDPAEALHSIKSSAANLGVGDVERIAADIEEHVRAGRTDALTQMVQELQTAFQEAKPHLEALKAASGSAGDSTG